MGRVRFTLAMAVATGTLAGLAGCAQHSTKEHYYLIAANVGLPYWKTMNEGFNKAAAQYGVSAELRGPDTFDPQDELKEMQQVVAGKPAGILVSVADAGLFREEINTAIQQGIPVITVDSDAPTSQRLFFIGTNNLEAGHLGGQRLVEQMNGKGNVVFYTNAGQPNLEERLKGYKDKLADHPDIKIVDVFDIKGDSNAAFDQTERYLGKTGKEKIDAFVCLEASSGRAVAEVLRRHQAADRVLIAMDVDPQTLNLIKSGEITATVSQKPYTMGYVGLKNLADLHLHKPSSFGHNYQVDPFAPYPLFVDTGTSLVDKSNVDLYLQGAQQAQQP